VWGWGLEEKLQQRQRQQQHQQHQRQQQQQQLLRMWIEMQWVVHVQQLHSLELWFTTYLLRQCDLCSSSCSRERQRQTLLQAGGMFEKLLLIPKKPTVWSISLGGLDFSAPQLEALQSTEFYEHTKGSQSAERRKS
jgi:hypothetical protein